MNNLKKIQLLFFCNLFLLPFLGAQGSIDFTPIEGLCSNDAENCTAAVAYPFSISVDEPSEVAVSHQIKLNGEEPVDDMFGNLSGIYPGYIISGDYPIGEHTLVVTVIAGEETHEVNMPLTIVDCVAPVISCVNGLTVTILPQPDGCCAQTVLASDLIMETQENCSEPVTYSIHKESDVISGADVPNQDQIVLELNCNDETPLIIRVYAWDNSYNPYSVQPDGSVGGPNYSFCQTYLLAQSWVSICESTYPMYSGEIVTEEAEGIAEVLVELVSENPDTAYTNSYGSYTVFGYDGHDANYILAPYLNENHQGGVTTFDALLIQKHILGIQYLGSPYKLIAADVNNSGHISTYDIVVLRKLILGIFDEFPNNTSWRFVDAAYMFPDNTNPWVEEFPEVINVNEPLSAILSGSFIGIKIGDVNGSVTPN